MEEQHLTLQIINRIRKACGKTSLDCLPAGSRQNSTDCVIARALHEIDPHVAVYQDVMMVDDLSFAKTLASVFCLTSECIGIDNESDLKMYVVPLPKSLSLFVENFDSGEYEDLIVEATFIVESAPEAALV